jgi:integrase/recombinase XerD
MVFAAVLPVPHPEVSMSDQTTAHITATTTLTPAITAWEVYLNDQGRSPHTIKAFIGDLNLLASYLPPDRTLGSITTQDLNNFLEWMQDGRGVPCSPKTLARRITSIKSFFRWLHGNGVLLVDPAEEVVQKAEVSPLPVVWTPEEVEAVVEAADRFRHGENVDLRHYVLVTLLLETGIKKGECLALSPNHLEQDTPEGAILFVRYADPKYRYKERKIALPDYWVEAYQPYAERYALTDRVFPWSQRRLEYLLEDLSNAAGLEKHLSFEMCRWTCALTDWRSGMEHNKIRQKLGLSKVQWREVKMKLQRLSGQV